MALQIILAEDEALVAMVIADGLEAEGHSVVVAGDGVQALAAARSLSALDVLITDLRMPNLGGVRLIRALWAERPDLPVIVITGLTLPGGVAALLGTIGADGPLALLHKPFHCAALSGVLHNMCAVTQPEPSRRQVLAG
jgi:two-component system OmpR family response regulator